LLTNGIFIASAARWKELSKARVKSRWISLLEALKYIQSIENSDALVAQVLLERCISDGHVPVKWGNC
jgi:hypothetical protein